MRQLCAAGSLLLLVLLLVLLLGVATSAAAAPPTQAHGAYCTPAGCAGRTTSTPAQAASFGLAVLAGAGLARRRSSRDA